MAYAQLVFPSTPQAGQVMKAIAKVLLGETNLGAIEGLATSAVIDPYNLGLGSYKSEIVNPASAAWSIAYPSGLPATDVFSLNTFTLSAPCITASKSKFVRFIVTNSAGAFTEPVNSGSTNYSLTTNYNIQVQGLSSIDASGNATNLTWRNNTGTYATIRKLASTTEPYVVWLSWSPRHLFIVSSVCNGAGRTCSHFTAEFPETTQTIYSASAPCLHITTEGGNNSATVYSALTANSSATANVISLLNTYDPTLGVIVGVRPITSVIGTTGLNSWASNALINTDQASIQSSAVYDSGEKYWSISPITINDISNGNGILNLSLYSNIWLGSNMSFENSQWTASDGNSYKMIHLYNSGLTAYSALMVKYG